MRSWPEKQEDPAEDEETDDEAGPTFWQHPWFRPLAGVGLAAAIAGIVYFAAFGESTGSDDEPPHSTSADAPETEPQAGSPEAGSEDPQDEDQAEANESADGIDDGDGGAVDTANDQSVAESLLLTLDDLSGVFSGWTIDESFTDGVDDPDDELDAVVHRECGDDEIVNTTARADVLFRPADGFFVSQSVVFFPSAAQLAESLEQQLAQLQCSIPVTNEFGHLDSDGTISNASLSEISFRDFADGTDAYELQFDMTSTAADGSTSTVTLYADVVFVRNGRTLLWFMAVGGHIAFPAVGLDALVQIAVDKALGAGQSAVAAPELPPRQTGAGGAA